MRDEFRLAHLDGETPLEVFADSCDWFAYKLLATPRIQRSSDADAADESSLSLNGNQQEEDRDEGDECLQRLATLLGSFFRRECGCLNVDDVTPGQNPKRTRTSTKVLFMVDQ